MLYVTTRSKAAVYTAPQTMNMETAPDGGLFLPMQFPFYGGEKLNSLLKMSFWDCVAEILNQFFPTGLRGAELSKRFGKVLTLRQIRYKITVAELWNERLGSYEVLAHEVLAHMGCAAQKPHSWAVIAVHVAVLFGLYGKLCGSGSLLPGERMPLAIGCGELDLAAAAMYAEQMGLPIGNVLCVCEENGMLWELLYKGETRLEWKWDHSETAPQSTPPENMERMIACRLGLPAVKNYLQILQNRGSYHLQTWEQSALKEGISVSVVSVTRTAMTIRQIYKNSHYLLSPQTAAVYSGLMDFRSLEAEGNPMVLLAEESPMYRGEAVLEALHLPVQSITAQIEALQRNTHERQGED